MENSPQYAADAATIFALSSGSPPAGVALIRVSGPRAGDAMDALLGGRPRPAPRRASLRSIVDPVDHHPLDQALLLWFPGPASATGEDMAEFHVHGGRAVVTAVLRSLSEQPGLRAAEAGEFTRRAFANGRIDLTEAEALGDLLTAETETQRRNALALADGALSRKLAAWLDHILLLSARVEAVLDFEDEADVPDLGDAFTTELEHIAKDVAGWCGRPAVERLRDGIRVVLAGPPNAGKSTLLNALAGREAAIVTPLAGTTRDLVEVPVSIGGIAFLLTDTAGLHEAAADAVEEIGIERARQAMARADILLWLGPPDEAPAGALRIAARSDETGFAPPDAADLILSARTGEGMERLVAVLGERAATLLPREDEVALSRRQRDGIEHLAVMLGLAGAEQDPLLVAEALRMARAAIDRLTGRAGTEDMLDTLFGRFCIGK
ncbi:tRNA uridine-5-carboxymethylaminomethyl(34) synthesis GTPase MnmE [Rhizorhabdus sp. FW153]|uniref:tRNA uridine-5-carboxymethylaminomethyl(34) synthesis GTPase MnmE n=1 Tax=Rhizorhabdus sp. FW153 TaxID=3400216 RepID=UPI003CF7CD32